MKTQILTFQCSFASHASFDSHKLYEVENEIFVLLYREVMRLPCSSNGNESACEAGDQGSIPGLGSSSGEGSGNPLQDSCLEAWWATVHGVAKSWT